jgi:metallo-beta-lactamase family protein
MFIMKFQFHGAAQTVTGSMVILTVNGHTVMFECGMFQGRRQEAFEKNRNFNFDPTKIEALVLTHAHIDHSGNIPNLVRKGFKGPIYATPPTVDLCRIMLRDSAYLQQKDIEFVNRIRSRKNEPMFKPLYTIEDAEAAMHLFVGVPYDKSFHVCEGVSATLREGGHILGSAGISMEITEKGKMTRCGFTGDIGRANMPILHDPNIIRDVDALIMESTYGNRLHGAIADVEEELVRTVSSVAASGGKIIIPAFAVGRTQEIVYHLHKLFDENRLPDMPVFVDSPLACDATKIFREHPECFDRETNRIFIRNNEDPFGFGRLTYVHDISESKNLNGLTYPHIIISASGMAEGGRILHHLRNNIENPKNMVLFVGYAAQETLARKMMDGARTVKIFGEEHTVRCKIKTMDAFSAHADSKDLLNYVSMTPPKKLKNVILMHGEKDQSVPFSEVLKTMGYRNVHYPALYESITI